MNIVEKFNKKQVEKLSKGANDVSSCGFASGDTVKVSYRIKEGETTRIQNFEGVVIAKNDSADNFTSSVTVRKISHGVGVERKFLIHSPLVEKIEVVKKGVVRRGKLYYLRNLRGKSARIQEKIDARQKKED